MYLLKSNSIIELSLSFSFAIRFTFTSLSSLRAKNWSSFKIIILKDNQFLALKKDKLVKVNLIVKLKEMLNLTILLLFNRYILSLNKDSITSY